jgi:hypothetical protein
MGRRLGRVGCGHAWWAVQPVAGVGRPAKAPRPDGALAARALRRWKVPARQRRCDSGGRQRLGGGLRRGSPARLWRPAVPERGRRNNGPARRLRSGRRPALGNGGAMAPAEGGGARGWARFRPRLRPVEAAAWLWTEDNLAWERVPAASVGAARTQATRERRGRWQLWQADTVGTADKI